MLDFAAPNLKFPVFCMQKYSKSFFGAGNDAVCVNYTEASNWRLQKAHLLKHISSLFNSSVGEP